eukprot:COSAG06_NODE_18866_length_864_cov_1.623529_1_plen_223_part_01
MVGTVASSTDARKVVRVHADLVKAAGALLVALLVVGVLVGIPDDDANPASHESVEATGRPPSVHAQCTLPYETLGGGNSSRTCYGRGWRLQNRRVWPDRAPHPARRWHRPVMHCDHSFGQPGRGSGAGAGRSAVTGVGGDAWYRFGGESAGEMWDALPTEPQRLGIAGSSELFGALTCGAQATAWVSGWDADSAERPPSSYRGPGTLPGDGPQWPGAPWQERV